MGHKITITTKRFEVKEEAREAEILDQPKFVQSWNYRTVIGIYPVPYDYRTPEDPDAGHGLKYECYTISTDISKVSVEFEEIPDWNLARITENDLKGSHGTLVLIITQDRDYESEIQEATFEEMLSSAIERLYPAQLANRQNLAQ
jgi:ribosomal protein RSM22 (predicted rRNA methylase)